MHAAAAQFVPQTPEQMQAQRWEREIDERNRPLTDEELDAMFPSGYKVSGFLFLLFGGLESGLLSFLSIQDQFNLHDQFFLIFF